MCGIVGYSGPRSAVEVLIDGLRRLEYRGYDSAGIGVHTVDGLRIFRRKGKIRELERLIAGEAGLEAHCGIGHTRWATHGRPSEENAHPHRAGDVVVVHNGIIENHIELRASLEGEGAVFSSETDTEIFAHLFDGALSDEPDLFAAVRRSLKVVEGSYAIAVLHAGAPDEIVCARRGSPLIVGIGENEVFLASDIPAILSYTREMVFLEDGDVARLRPGEVVITDLEGNPVERPVKRIDWDPLRAERGGYPHFMLKEIHEQPHAVADTLLGRVSRETGRIYLDADLPEELLERISRVVFIACGTSFHAGLLAAYQFERYLGLPARAEFASEFRYRAPVIDPRTLVVTISQSGETADTLAAAALAKESGAHVMAICNVLESSLARMADSVLYTHAGPEISVASTKAFVTQLVALQLLLLRIGEVRGCLDEVRARAWIEQLSHVPKALQQVLKLEKRIARIARRFADVQDMLYLGRGEHYPLALEGALKLKEISYIHAEAYPAGEMKHGPIALIDAHTPVLAIVHDSPVRDKVVANIEEVRAREGKVLALTLPDDDQVAGLAEWTIPVPTLGPQVDPILLSLPLQLFAYHVAVFRGTDVDQPRNLAKSVTVE